MTSLDGDQVVMVAGMSEALDSWLRDWKDLFLNRPRPATEAESHARRMEEAGLLGRAHSIMFTLQSNAARGERGLPGEPMPPWSLRTAAPGPEFHPAPPQAGSPFVSPPSAGGATADDGASNRRGFDQ